jgi:two-component system, LytTR family, sensor kinase
MIRMKSSSGLARRITRDYALSIGFWLSVSLLVSWQQNIIVVEEHLRISYGELIRLYAVRYFAVAVLTPPLFYITERWPVNTVRTLWRVAAYMGGFVLFSMAFALIRWCLLPPWVEERQAWGPRTWSTLTALTYGTFATIFLVYLGIMIAAHAWCYFTRSHRQEVERLELQQALAQSELQALKTQIHPHFLFNTLQGISALIDTDKSAAQKMLAKLGSLLRTALRHGSSDLIPFREELEFLRSYLDLEMMRLGKRLVVRWQISGATGDVLVPQLILQPLVENAIVHGIACCREGGWLEIEAKRVENRLRIEICNSVCGQSQRGMGVGIQNTQSRLKYLYADEATFEFRLGPEGLATATLQIPALTGFAGEPQNMATALEV